MKKILLLFCLLPLYSFAQRIPDYGLNKVHIANGEKIIQAELIPVSSDPDLMPERYYFWYSSNNIHVTQGGFSGKLLNGTYTEYYLNKNLKEQGSFKKGLKNGTWKDWNDNSQLIQVYNWENGQKSGRFSIYDREGKVTNSGVYKKDILVVPDTASFLQRINIFKKIHFGHKKAS